VDKSKRLDKMKKIAILGSTGSIGVNALDVVKDLKGCRVLGLSAGSNIKLLRDQVYRFSPQYVSIFEEGLYRELKRILPRSVKILKPGIAGLCEMAALKSADMVLNALSGSVGFMPLISSIKASKRIALANKEPMVMAGERLMREAERWQAEIIPVDSEPSAIFQCLAGIPRRDLDARIKRIFLTASGGAFYKYSGDLSKIKPAQALKHPNWKMGKKITVDSATLMNKGLEAIEIKNLFSLELKKINILVHPQSIVHSAVEFKDNSVLAQLSNPDMRLPIQYALTWPERQTSPVRAMDFFALSRLDFFRPDFKKFPCLKLAFECAEKGGFFPAILNAANEEAVAAFLKGKLPFTGIPDVIKETLSANIGSGGFSPSFAEIVEMDGWAREKAGEVITRGVTVRRNRRLED